MHCHTLNICFLCSNNNKLVKGVVWLLVLRILSSICVDFLPIILIPITTSYACSLLLSSVLVLSACSIFHASSSRIVTSQKRTSLKRRTRLVEASGYKQ